VNYRDDPELSNPTQRGKRNSELFTSAGRIPYSDNEAISMHLIDGYMIDGNIRNDRPMPTDEKQKRLIIEMNKSDNKAINELGIYKHKLEIRFNDEILLTKYQASWVDYIVGVSDTKPELPDLEARALQEINADADIPF